MRFPLALPLIAMLALPAYAGTAANPQPIGSPEALTAPPKPKPKPKPSLKIPALQFALGAAAAAISVPVGIALSGWVGTLSPNYLVSGVPALLLYAALPAFAVTAAAYWMGNALAPGAYRFWPAFGMTLGMHIIVTAVAVLLGGYGGDLGIASTITLIEMVLLPATASLGLWLFRRPPTAEPLIASAPPPAPPSLPAFTPHALTDDAHRAATVPLLAFRF